jgi:hypothetical protein
MAIEKQTAENNWFLKWWSGIKNTKKNYEKVRSSPYASLTLALKARKLIIGLLIPWLIYMTYSMVTKMNVNGVAGTIQKVVMIGMMAYIIWKIYSTIPEAKRQIEYYKKYPHTINYCPTNTKQTIDEILAKVKENKEKLELNNKQEVINDVRQKEKTRGSTTDSSSSSSTSNSSTDSSSKS